MAKIRRRLGSRIIVQEVKDPEDVKPASPAPKSKRKAPAKRKRTTKRKKAR